MKRVTVLLMGFVFFLNAEFSRSGGVVKDSVTQLEWQDDYSDNGGSIKDSKWSEALIYCDELVLDSKSDWRLPSLNELGSIVDYSESNPAISPIFKNVTYYSYWSSTTDVSDSSNVWNINFDFGYDNNWGSKTSYKLYVRCVRGGV